MCNSFKKNKTCVIFLKNKKCVSQTLWISKALTFKACEWSFGQQLGGTICQRRCTQQTFLFPTFDFFWTRFPFPTFDFFWTRFPFPTLDIFWTRFPFPKAWFLSKTFPRPTFDFFWKTFSFPAFYFFWQKFPFDFFGKHFHFLLKNISISNILYLLTNISILFLCKIFITCAFGKHFHFQHLISLETFPFPMFDFFWKHFHVQHLISF